MVQGRVSFEEQVAKRLKNRLKYHTENNHVRMLSRQNSVETGVRGEIPRGKVCTLTQERMLAPGSFAAVQLSVQPEMAS